MKNAVGTMKSDLQQFRDLAAFAAFGSDLDPVSQAQLDRGYRLTELLKQGINAPVPVEEQVIVLYAGTRGYLDTIAVADVARFESELLEWFHSRHSDVLSSIKNDGVVPDEEALEAAIAAFVDQFVGSEGSGGEPDAEEQAEATSRMVDASNTLPEEDVSRADAV